MRSYQMASRKHWRDNQGHKSRQKQRQSTAKNAQGRGPPRSSPIEAHFNMGLQMPQQIPGFVANLPITPAVAANWALGPRPAAAINLPVPGHRDIESREPAAPVAVSVDADQIAIIERFAGLLRGMTHDRRFA